MRFSLRAVFIALTLVIFGLSAVTTSTPAQAKSVVKTKKAKKVKKVKKAKKAKKTKKTARR